MIFPCPILDTTPASEAATTQSCPFPGFLSADGFVMTNQFDQLLADFSDGASDVIDALVASATGVRSPSLSVRGDGQQARQVNAGSLVRLTDGTYHVIAFTNGAQVSGQGRSRVPSAQAAGGRTGQGLLSGRAGEHHWNRARYWSGG